MVGCRCTWTTALDATALDAYILSSINFLLQYIGSGWLRTCFIPSRFLLTWVDAFYNYYRRLIIVPPFVVGIRCAGRLRVSYFYYFLCVDGGWRCGALDVLVPLFPSTYCCLVDGCLLVSLIEVLFLLLVACCFIVYLIVGM